MVFKSLVALEDIQLWSQKQNLRQNMMQMPIMGQKGLNLIATCNIPDPVLS